MNNSLFSGPDPARSRLRSTVATIEQEMSRLPEPTADENGSPRGRLLTAWADLVEQLALGPEPEVRTCPVCSQVGMRAATLCGHCWTKLTPPTERDDAV